ncbi:Hypothetical predicted protein [Paramuricea clavata]|uniref:Uncharacterized protein n=1 Tax=Paramuricea clavata TaxID=317549 RepID=A0A6S7ICC6_PARCT|nr:Hypothetical predicted protein [Paramuricea clavata]
MASGNEVRSFIRGINIVRNKAVLSSLQSCKLKENLSVLEDKIAKVSSGSQLWEHLRGFRAILDCLLANVACNDGSTRVKCYKNALCFKQVK